MVARFGQLVWVTAAVSAILGVDFVPNSTTKTCTGDEHSTPWLEKVIGVNIGGWLVLEPWITPSLFYQFLGQDSSKTAMDTYTFCKVLGAKEGNKQLRRHWASWVTEGHIAKLASLGINALRLPVGDWMYTPYHPFVGCTDGALEQVDKLLGWANKYSLKVLIDVHAVRGSANGLDNGGVTTGLKWTSTLQDVAADAITFEHWPRRNAEWVGTFNKQTGTYSNVNWTHMEASLDMLTVIARRYANVPEVLGLEPVNEPWQFTPIDFLQQFYWEGYLRVKSIAPSWRFVMHDSFRFDPNLWGGFMAGCPDIALDTHIYQAWFDPSTRFNFYSNACAQKEIIHTMEMAFGPVIVGEWSLATDNCGMWLNGFNDNLPGYPKLPCKFVLCPEPYMGPEQPGAPPSILKPLQGPFGTGVSGPQYGLCPIDRDWLKLSPCEELGNSRTRKASDLDPGAGTPEDDDTDTVMRQLGAKKLQAFGMVAHGFFFWNFRTELEDQWSYLRAVERGWLPADARQLADVVSDACDREDVHCAHNPDATDDKLRAAMAFAVGNDVQAVDYFAQLEDGALRAEADKVFDQYWVAHRAEGNEPAVARRLACNFDGAAKLTETPYKCVARRAEEKATRDGMAYCVGYDPLQVAEFEQLSGEALYNRADVIFDAFWEAHRYEGATCDFGGGAALSVVPELVDNGTQSSLAASQEHAVILAHPRRFRATLSGLLAVMFIFVIMLAVANSIFRGGRLQPPTTTRRTFYSVSGPELVPLTLARQNGVQTPASLIRRGHDKISNSLAVNVPCKTRPVP